MLCTSSAYEDGAPWLTIFRNAKTVPSQQGQQQRFVTLEPGADGHVGTSGGCKKNEDEKVKTSMKIREDRSMGYETQFPIPKSATSKVVGRFAVPVAG